MFIKDNMMKPVTHDKHAQLKPSLIHKENQKNHYKNKGKHQIFPTCKSRPKKKPQAAFVSYLKLPSTVASI